MGVFLTPYDPSNYRFSFNNAINVIEDEYDYYMFFNPQLTKLATRICRVFLNSDEYNQHECNEIALKLGLMDWVTNKEILFKDPKWWNTQQYTIPSNKLYEEYQTPLYIKLYANIIIRNMYLNTTSESIIYDESRDNQSYAKIKCDKICDVYLNKQHPTVFKIRKNLIRNYHKQEPISTSNITMVYNCIKNYLQLHPQKGGHNNIRGNHKRSHSRNEIYGGEVVSVLFMLYNLYPILAVTSICILLIIMHGMIQGLKYHYKTKLNTPTGPVQLSTNPLENPLENPTIGEDRKSVV